MKKTKPRTRSVLDVHHELRRLRHRAALLSRLRNELVRHYGGDEPEYLELDRDHFEAPLGSVVERLGLELAELLKDVRQQRRELEQSATRR